MANEKVTELPGVTNALLTDVIYAVQGGISSKETLQQVSQLMSSQIIQNFSGNPNGNVAGNIYQLCWDITDTILYVCTTSGSTLTAVWIPVIGQLNDGQLRIGDTGSVPVKATLTAGSGINIVNGPGSITISASGLAGTTVVNVTGTSQAMTINSGYIANNAGLVTLTLPLTAPVGSILYIVGSGAGGWQVNQTTPNQQIFVGSSGSTVGLTGFIASTSQHNSIVLMNTTADNIWTSLGGPQGNITVS